MTEGARIKEQRPAWKNKIYGSRWQRYRSAYIHRHPLCKRCQLVGRMTMAQVVDHITPHKGDINAFWDPANHQPLCKPCHDRKTATEDGGFGRPQQP